MRYKNKLTSLKSESGKFTSAISDYHTLLGFDKFYIVTQRKFSSCKEIVLLLFIRGFLRWQYARFRCIEGPWPDYSIRIYP